MKQINAETGFTLLELLIVLSITLIFVLLAIPFNQKGINRSKENSFTTLLDSDVLYLQNTSRGGLGSYSLSFINGFYYIEQGAAVQKLRHYPDNWRLDTLNRPISFEADGRIRYPDTITLRTENGPYDLIFSFGRGRHRIAK